MRGKVKWFDMQKGWGFIREENGQQYFCHWRDIKSGRFKFLKEGERVAFDIEETPKGLKAVNITIEG